jgi:hypothetical protein
MISAVSPHVVSDEIVWLRADRWVPLVVWLSLDAVQPRWSEVGFPGSAGARDAWIRLLRRCILQAAKARWSRPQAPTTLVTDVLAAVAAELGAGASLALIRFSRFTFAMGPEDHPELFAWHEILDRCEPDAAGLQALAPWDDLRAALVEGLRRARAAVVREDLALPLSSWDLAMLALRGIDDADPGAPEHPMRLVEWTSRAASARALWRAILPLFDDDRRDALAWNATRLGWSAGLLPSYASLPDPATLVEATHD